MSVKLMSAIWENAEALKGNRLLVMLAIADHANDDGHAYPGVDRIAKKCRLKHRAVQAIIGALEDESWLRRDIQKGIETRHGKTNLYAINLAKIGVHGGASLEGCMAVHGVHDGAPHGVHGRAPKPSVEPPVLKSTSEVASREGGAQKPESAQPASPAAPPPSPQNADKTTSKTKRGTRLPDDWELPDDWRDWAKQEHPRVDVDLEAAKFRDHWIAATGRNASKLNWEATWRNWIRRAANDYQPRRTHYDDHAKVVEFFYNFDDDEDNGEPLPWELPRAVGGPR